MTLQLENLSKFPSQINITISKNLNPCPIGLKKPSRLSDNNGGGEPPMDNKYVTHQELELSNEKMLRHIDNKFADMQSKMDNKFANMQNQFRNIDKKIDLTNEKLILNLKSKRFGFMEPALPLYPLLVPLLGF